MNNHIDDLIKTLRSGGVILFPTETVYAIGCDATNAAAVEKLYSIKSRGHDKPLQVLVQSISDISRYAVVDGFAEKLIEKFSMHPITYVLNALPSAIAPQIVTTKTIGIRVPHHRLALELLEGFGYPIAASSANVHGAPSPISFKTVDAKIKSRVDFFVEGTCDIGMGSTVVDLSTSKVKILREGTVSASDIEKAIVDIRKLH